MFAFKKTSAIPMPVLSLMSIKDSRAPGKAGSCSQCAVQHNLKQCPAQYRALLQIILLLLHGSSPLTPMKRSTGAGGMSEGLVEKSKVIYTFEVCLAVSRLKHGFLLVTVTKSSEVRGLTKLRV